MKCRSLLLALCLLAGCKTIDVNARLGAQASPLQARELVGLVYAQAPDEAITRLDHATSNFMARGLRIKARWPQLKPEFEAGRIGLTLGGFVALRDEAGDAAAALHELVREENVDRAVLYGAGADQVGHGGDDLQSWLPYEQSGFGEAWVDQAPAGWWYLDEAGVWHQKDSSAPLKPRELPLI